MFLAETQRTLSVLGFSAFSASLRALLTVSNEQRYLALGGLFEKRGDADRLGHIRLEV
jgi:hypothetical protein